MSASGSWTITLVNVTSGEIGTIRSGDVDPDTLRLLQLCLGGVARRRIELPTRPGYYLAIEPLRGGAMFSLLDRGGAVLVTGAAVSTARGASLARARLGWLPETIYPLPWLLARPEPALAEDATATAWMVGMVRCIGWALLLQEG